MKSNYYFFGIHANDSNNDDDLDYFLIFGKKNSVQTKEYGHNHPK